MTKKLTIISIFMTVLFYNFFGQVYALEETTSSSELIDKLKQIEILKEKIATKVAEIRDNEKGATLGNIKKIDKNTITVDTKRGDQTVYFSDDTEIYLLSKAEKTKIQSSKLTEGDRITVLGYLGTDKTTLNTKYIYVMQNIISVSGKITDKDSKNYTITVDTKDGQKIVVDIETYTKTYSLNLSKKTLDKGGFSKLNSEDLVRVIGTPNTKEDNRISATRIWGVTASPSTTPVVTPNE